jgi:hypothetical protein
VHRHTEDEGGNANDQQGHLAGARGWACAALQLNKPRIQRRVLLRALAPWTLLALRSLRYRGRRRLLGLRLGKLCLLAWLRLRWLSARRHSSVNVLARRNPCFMGTLHSRLRAAL